MLGSPKICKFGHAFLWDYSYKSLKLAQFLGHLSHFGPRQHEGLVVGLPASAEEGVEVGRQLRVREKLAWGDNSHSAKGPGHQNQRVPGGLPVGFSESREDAQGPEGGARGSPGTPGTP